MTLRILPIIAILFSFNVLADQCSVLPMKSAVQAQDLLEKHLHTHSIAVIDKYCESCRDESVQPIVIDKVELRDFQVVGFKQVYVNNKKLDLAYIYLGGVNIAEQIGCKTRGISKYL